MIDDDFGILTMAFGGDRYIQQAQTLALSLKLNMPTVCLALITDRRGEVPPFDRTIPVDTSRGGGVAQKIWLDEYTPFAKTLFCDSDCVVTRPFKAELQAIMQFDFTPVMGTYLGQGDSDEFYVADLGLTLRQLGLNRFPKFNGGVYFFKHCPFATDIFHGARALLPKAADLGLKAFDAGVADETLLGLSMARYDGRDFYHDNGNLMRTPIGMVGRLTIDPFGGGCSFIKHGELVRPAICHFAAPYARYADYIYVSDLVRHPGRPAWTRSVSRAAARARARLAGVYKR